MYKVTVIQKKQKVNERHRVRERPRVHSVWLCSDCTQTRRNDSILMMIEHLHAGHLQPPKVQNEKLGTETAVLIGNATESGVVPPKHKVPDPHLGKVMPRMQKTPWKKMPMPRRLVERTPEAKVPEASQREWCSQTTHTDQKSRRPVSFNCLLLRVLPEECNGCNPKR